MNNKKGFTLVEVIISIAALGIICMVLLRLFVVAGTTNSKAGDMQGAGLCAASVTETLAGADSLKSALEALGLELPDELSGGQISFKRGGYDVEIDYRQKGSYPGTLYELSVKASLKGAMLACVDTAKYYKEARND